MDSQPDHGQQADARIRQDAERYRLLVESIRDCAIYLIDPHGNIVSWNAGAEQIKGYRADEIIGQHISRFYPADAVQAGKPEEELRVAAADGKFKEESWRVRKDGYLFWADVLITALRDEAGTLVGFSKVTRDLSERRRLEEQARRLASEQAARAEAEAASRRKDQFLLMLAHELRNPLAPLFTGLALLQKPGIESAARERALEMMGRQIRHMSRMIDDLLDASRIVRGTVQVRRERLDLARLVVTACEDRRAAIEEAGRFLAVEAPQTPRWVNGDQTRLTQVVANLLDNAVKFTDGGAGIAVCLRSEERGQWVRLSVSDNGIGIEPAALPYVFDALSQADSSLARSRGGLGLGLTMVKGLVELHGGEVGAASAGPGCGAHFFARLPQEQEPAALVDKPAPMATEGRRLRILVIEDHRDAADSLRLLLELMGHEVAVAYTGTDGLREALRWLPEVVVSDIGLPGLNGLEVAAELRRHGPTRTARLVALSGYGSEEDQARSRKAGFDFHLRKPADPAALQAILQGGTAGAN